MLSQTAIYALRAIGYIAAQKDERSVLAKTISQKMHIPKNFLSKILHQLVQAGLIQSIRGTGGGFRLAKPAQQIHLREVVELFMNLASFRNCFLGVSCGGPCGLNKKWKAISEQITSLLDDSTIDQIFPHAEEHKKEAEKDTGRCREHSSDTVLGGGYMKPTETLKHEHEVILLVLAGVEREAQKIRKTRKADVEKLNRIVDFFRNFTDRCHHGKEEKHLFVKLAERGMDKESGPIAVMLAEHEMGREKIRAIADALPKAKNGNAKAVRILCENLEAYVALLRAHIDKENNVLFPMAEQILGDEDQKQLSEAFEKLESEEMGKGVHEKYHALAHELSGTCPCSETAEE